MIEKEEELTMKIIKALSLMLALVMLVASMGIAALAEDVTEITVWTKDRHDQEFMSALVEKFNAENPDIKVIYEMYTDNYQQVIEIASSTGELPAIFCVNGTAMTDSIRQRDQMLYIDEYLTDEMKEIFTSDFFVEGLNMHDGKIFTLPSTGTTLRLVYNQDIFDRVGIEGPPTTLEEMVDYAITISEELSGEGIYGFALPLANPRTGLQRGITNMVLMDGNPVFEGFDFAQGTYDFTSYTPYIEALAEIWAAEAAFPGCESLNIDPLRTQFADGKIAMYMTYNHSEYGVYTSQFPTDINWQYALLPTVSGEVTGSQKLSAGTWYAMSTNCPDPEKGWRVLEAFYNLDNLIEYYELGLGVSVLPAVIEQAKTPEAIEKVPFMGIQPTDKMWPLEPINIVPEGDDWGMGFAQVIFGETDDLAGIIEDLNTRYQAAYEKSVADGLNSEVHYPSISAADPVNTSK